MRKFLAIGFVVALSIVPAAADIIDERVEKAVASVQRAEAKLAAALACQADKVACLIEETGKHERAMQNAAARFEAAQAALDAAARNE
jgi:hypothetical protein